MDLRYPPEVEAFRAEVRQWLQDNLPEGWVDHDNDLPTERAELEKVWLERLHAGGWICATWPEEYGGKQLSVLESAVVAEEFAAVGAALEADFFGDTLVGPTILTWGTESQKHEFLPKIIRGEMRWCQGFSEPNSGSDLASLTTSATLDGDEWVINGQKVWTTQGLDADYCFLLTRTDPHASKHKGLSYLLVPMHQPGIEVRGITQPDGTAEFCEVFFDNARCPSASVVGGVNNGWTVANSTLTLERGPSASTGYWRFAAEFDTLVRMARERGVLNDATIRQRLMVYYSKIQIMRYGGMRMTTAAATGRSEAIERLAATNKVFWSEMHRDAMELAVHMLGAEGMVIDVGQETWPGITTGERRPGYPVSGLMASFFFSRSETIWGGTSQIQRNIIAERALGLPRERSITPVESDEEA